MSTNRPHSNADSWDTYWHDSDASSAYSAGGANHPGVRAFWNDFFQSLAGRFAPPRLCDLATGNGAVIETALRVLDNDGPVVTCIDISESSIRNVQARFPGVTGLVSDAISIPLDDKSFDIVTSQFGIEYAGPEAIPEAARLVAPGGVLGLLVHIENGLIHKECEKSLAAIVVARESNFVALAIDLFRHGFAAVRGADRVPYDEAGARLAPAVGAIEKAINEYGDEVAGGVLARLYDDVARIHGRMPHYDPDEVLSWLSAMERELAAYGERMASMISTVADKESIRRVCAQLENNGLNISEVSELLVDDETSPLAWLLVATRPD